MKTTILICLMAFSTQLFAQNIWRCNNDPNVPTSATLFRTLQEAHDAASNGDIIYVEPSYNTGSYGNLICTKTLRIFGNGYSHANNINSSQNWDYRISKVDDITILTGSGTVLQGLSINQVAIKAPNTTVTRCSIFYSINLYRTTPSENASGAIISNNFSAFNSNQGWTITTGSAYSSYNTTTCFYTANQIQNVTIKNNLRLSLIYGGSIQSGGSCTVQPVSIPTANNFIVANNTFEFYGNYNQNGYVKDCQACTLHSNIFPNSPLVGIFSNCPSTVASYNVCGTNPCVFGSNNVDAASDATIFIGGQNSQLENQLKLTNSSPAKAAGLGGIDAGAFGGATPYVLSGLPAIPQITSYSKNASSGIYTSSTPMSITISVKGNN